MVVNKDSIFKIKARAMLKELRIARERGFRQIDVEYDNSLLVKIVVTGGVTSSRTVKLQLIH